MVSFPPCKVNLGLDVIRKRPDGYHDIETCVYPLPLTDILEALPAEKMIFTSTGMAIPGEADNNLCLKAFHLLKKDFDISPVQIHLHKLIPTGAGLGGGSSDGAHCLRLLNSIFQLNLSDEQLTVYASHLGSDCAFFIRDQPMIGKGRGEILHPAEVSLKDYYFVLVNPGIHISTRDAYAGIKPSIPVISIEDILQRPVEEWKDVLKNDFESSVFNKQPRINFLKDMMYSAGAMYASMSGSGSSVYGIFRSRPSLPEVKNTIIWEGFLG
jgi:4-diphosphocytidyl-2-C-methyl-D-erythritol kinase